VKVLVFGATGMVGQGVLRECVLDPDVAAVQTVGRSATGAQHAKVREVVHDEMTRYVAIEPQLAGFDACFFCLGISSVGMDETEYTRITYAITMAAADTLSRLNPAMTFIYVSGAGTDSSERGRVMWARVKGKTENALQRLPFKAAYAFRPGIIQPLHGVRSKTPAYHAFYVATKPILSLAHWLLPGLVLTTEEIGRAMLVAAKRGAPKPVLESRDISALARL